MTVRSPEDAPAREQSRLLDVVVPELEYASVPGRTALEEDFPGAFLSPLAEHESWRKEVHRPATHTHKWWAQRLGTVFRGIIAAAVTTTSDEAIAAYQGALRLKGLVIFDPFAGSGTTLAEAARLGAHVVGRDVNPVATLVQRQALQRWNTERLDDAFNSVAESCAAPIRALYRTALNETVLYYFWVAVAPCPDCGTEVMLFSNYVFARHVYPKRFPEASVICPQCLGVERHPYDVGQVTCSQGHLFDASAGPVTGPRLQCVNGHRSRVIDALKGQPPRHIMYAKLVLRGDGSKSYEAVDEFDRALFAEAESKLSSTDDLVLPEGTLDEGYNTRQAMRWGYRRWLDFFNARQLYSLGLIGSAIRVLPDSPEREALTALHSGTLEFNNVFCSFKGEGTGAVRHMFSNHVLKPERTPLEAHPWGTPASSGSFSTLYRSRVLRAHQYKQSPIDLIRSDKGAARVAGLSYQLAHTVVDRWPSEFSNGVVYVSTGDSGATDIPDGSVDLVITDPPFMDNVHYSELADFFHAWLRSLRPFAGYPDQSTTRVDEEVQSTSAAEFEQAIARVWKECARVLRDSGILAFTFHQARIEGWVALMRALRSANLTVTGVSPVKSEMSSSVTKSAASEPSNLDAVVVCRKGSAQPFARSVEEAERKMKDSLGRLRQAGVQVGAADVRSTVRGAVLSLLTSDIDTSIDELVAAAESAAGRAAGEASA